MSTCTAPDSVETKPSVLCPPVEAPQAWMDKANERVAAYKRYQELGCVRLLKEDLDRRSVLSKRRCAPQKHFALGMKPR